MEFPEHLLLPYIITNVVALLLIFLSLNKPTTSRFMFVLIFLGYGIVSLYFALTGHQVLVDFFGSVALKETEGFIYGPFAENGSTILMILAAYQFLTAAFIAYKVPYVRIGVVMGVVFFICTAILGFGSFIPMPLLAAIALLFILAVNYKRPIWFVPKKEIRQRKKSMS